MIAEYVEEALRKAHYEIIDNGPYAGGKHLYVIPRFYIINVVIA